MSKYKIIRFSTCYDCVYCEEILDDDRNYIYKCNDNKYKIIKNHLSIPEWCKLEDYKE